MSSSTHTTWGDVVVTMVLGVIIIGALIFGTAARYSSIRRDFEQKCLAAHPNAHVAGSAGKVLFCLGPNGEVWDMR